MSEKDTIETGRRVVLGLFQHEAAAQSALDSLITRDFPLDRVSVLGRAAASGDDPLGIYYPSAGERIRGWGKMGAFWGGLFGLLGGAAGMFMLPGVGLMVALGPLAEALVATAAGAGIGGGVMMGGAALSQLSQAIHRMGVPQERIEALQDQLAQGHYLVMLIVGEAEAESSAGVLDRAGAEQVETHPYVGLTDALAEKRAG